MPEITDLLPPSNPNEEQHRWQGRISLAVIAIGALTMVNTWTMWGLWPVSLVFAGFATIASADDATKEINKIQKQITAQSDQMRRDKNELKMIALQSTLNQIFDAMCGAYRNSRIEEGNQWEQQFTEKLIEYNQISPAPYPMRRCT